MSSREERLPRGERLPLGAVRTTEGDVVVPASRRSDGSTRKPIRIRQGYVPQDEVPKYKTVGQRRREQEAKRAAGEKAGGDGAVDALQMDNLSLEQKKEPRERPRTGGDRPLRQDQGGPKLPVTKEANTKTAASDETNQHQQLKRQLTKINKQLKEITKLEDMEASTLSSQQKHTLGRKATLQQQRNDIIAELNGSSSSSGPRPKVAISL